MVRAVGVQRFPVGVGVAVEPVEGDAAAKATAPLTEQQSVLNFNYF